MCTECHVKHAVGRNVAHHNTCAQLQCQVSIVNTGGRCDVTSTLNTLPRTSTRPCPLQTDRPTANCSQQHRHSSVWVTTQLAFSHWQTSLHCVGPQRLCVGVCVYVCAVHKNGNAWLHYWYTGRTEGVWRMRRHGPVTVQCTDSVVFPVCVQHGVFHNDGSNDWPPSLSRDRKWPRVTRCTRSRHLYAWLQLPRQRAHSVTEGLCVYLKMN